MQIDIDLLFTWGAIVKNYKKTEVIFDEGDCALYYYQIMQGTVKMFNLNDTGKEFTQGIFCEGRGFGEPPLFIDEVYPSTAIAVEDSVIIKISKDKFLKILDEYPMVQKTFLRLFAKRVYSKSTAAKFIMNNTSENRILGFLATIKKKDQIDDEELYPVPFTRQEIANHTGLTVETVIRVLSKLNKQGKVQVIKHKLYY
ncbi:MAG: Crp/Fnr family transcriptional regulator [Flavobacterium sp.]